MGRGPAEARRHREGHHPGGPGGDGPGGVPQAGQAEVFSSQSWIRILYDGNLPTFTISAQVKETWNMYELDLINYQNKCRIIRGWDDLFNKLKENINQVAAMKLSPYYKVRIQFSGDRDSRLPSLGRCSRRRLSRGRTSSTGSTLSLTCGSTCRVAGCIWRASSGIHMLETEYIE